MKEARKYGVGKICVKFERIFVLIDGKRDRMSLRYRNGSWPLSLADWVSHHDGRGAFAGAQTPGK